MTKLNQLVATEKATKEKVNKQTAPLFHNAKNGALFAGLSKTYEPLDEDGEQFPDESVRVQHTVQEILDEFARATAPLLDVQLTKETANTEAFADVVVDEQVIIPNAPVTFLLQLEKQLTQEVRGLVVSLPTLDPAQEWDEDSSGRRGVYKTGNIRRHKTKKVTKPIVLYPATPEHPAQTQLVNDDVLAGYWSERRFSGAISGQRKQELLDRVDDLIRAVKFARESANNRQADEKVIGDAVFAHLFS